VCLSPAIDIALNLILEGDVAATDCVHEAVVVLAQLAFLGDLFEP